MLHPKVRSLSHSLCEPRGRMAAAALAMVLALAGPGLTPALAQAQPPAGIDPAIAPLVGVWIDDTGKGAVEVTPCGDRLCGHIVWLKEATDKRGRPLTDGYNPDPARRGRSICGLQVIGEVKRMPNGAWDGGWIYDPKEGKQFDVMLSARSADRLTVTGYLGVKFLSETFVWTRAPATLPRCQPPQVNTKL